MRELSKQWQEAGRTRHSPLNLVASLSATDLTEAENEAAIASAPMTPGFDRPPRWTPWRRSKPADLPRPAAPPIVVSAPAPTSDAPGRLSQESDGTPAQAPKVCVCRRRGVRP